MCLYGKPAGELGVQDAEVASSRLTLGTLKTGFLAGSQSGICKDDLQ